MVHSQKLLTFDPFFAFAPCVNVHLSCERYFVFMSIEVQNRIWLSYTNVYLTMVFALSVQMWSTSWECLTRMQSTEMTIEFALKSEIPNPIPIPMPLMRWLIDGVTFYMHKSKDNSDHSVRSQSFTPEKFNWLQNIRCVV